MRKQISRRLNSWFVITIVAIVKFMNRQLVVHHVNNLMSYPLLYQKHAAYHALLITVILVTIMGNAHCVMATILYQQIVIIPAKIVHKSMQIALDVTQVVSVNHVKQVLCNLQVIRITV